MSWTSDVTFSGTSTHHTLDCRTVAEIQNKVIQQSERNAVSRFWHARNDKEMIGGWKSELSRILVVFNVCFMLSCLVVIDCPPSRRN